MTLFGTRNPVVLVLLSTLLISLQGYSRGIEHPIGLLPQAAHQAVVRLGCSGRALLATTVLAGDAWRGAAPLSGHLAVLEFQARLGHCIDKP